MAFEIIREIPSEELSQPSLDPIARALKKIPGVGEFLSRVQAQTSPKGFYGPGVLAQILGALGGQPRQQVYDKSIGASETMFDLAASMTPAGKSLKVGTLLPKLLPNAVPKALGGLSIPLRTPGGTIPERIGQATVLPMLEHLLAGNVDSPITGAAKGALGGATQGMVDPIMGAIKQKGMRAAAQKADAAYTEALGSHADQASQSIMDDAKSMIPAWKDLPSSMHGLIDAVVGKGQRLLSEGFDTAMAGVYARGERKAIALPLADIKKLGVALVEGDVTTAGARDVMMGRAQANEVAEKALGLWQKDPGLYGRVVGALDDAGIGDPAARGAYKFGQGVIKYVDASKAIQDGVVHTDRLVKGMDSVKLMKILDRRNMGHAFEGPFQAARGGPLDPNLPQFGAEPLIQARPLGSPSQRTQAGAATGSGLGGLTGTGMGGYGPLAILGRVAASVAPDEWVTRAPGTQALVENFGQNARLFGAAGRDALQAEAQNYGFLPSVIPEADRATIDAEIAARLKAIGEGGEGGAPEDGLELELAPKED